MEHPGAGDQRQCLYAVPLDPRALDVAGEIGGFGREDGPARRERRIAPPFADLAPGFAITASGRALRAVIPLSVPGPDYGTAG